MGLTGEVLDDAELCLNEVVANILQHGGGHPMRPIEIALERTVDAVRMTIADHGRPFNPLDHPAQELPASLEAARAGGLGIHLVRTYATHVQYRRDDDRNMLTLVFGH